MTGEERNPMEFATRAMALARAMRNLGRWQRAVEKYDEALAALPLAIEALDECLALLGEVEAWQEIADRCESWLEDFPDHATNDNADRLHAQRIDALVHLGGLERAFDTYGLRPISGAIESVKTSEILCVMVLRNEVVRLPHLLDHHRRIGVDRFLVVDNGSTDGSVEFLMDQRDTIVWQSMSSYRSANCGAVWWQLLLRRYATNNWCLVVDADEFFIYPGWESKDLHSLCAELDVQGSTCLPAILVDMYGANRLSESVIHGSTDLLQEFPYFDRNWYRMRSPYCGPRHNLINHWGGVRARVFGDQSLGSYLLDKVPLFRSRPDQILMSGNHWLDRPSGEIANGRGALLHFKYDAGFTALVEREAERSEHAGAGRAYRKLNARIENWSDPVFFDPDYSVRYDNSEHLERIGILRPLTPECGYPPPGEFIHRPSISGRSGSGSDPVDAPFWSLVLVAEPTHLLARIEDALTALNGQPPSEILAIVTGGDDPPDLRSGRDDVHTIRVITTENHLTEVEALNLGLDRSNGRWVHLLEFGARPTVDVYADAQSVFHGDRDRSLSVLVESADLMVSALSLALDIAPSSILVRREAFAAHGGLSTTIEGAATWEFVQRIAAETQSLVGLLPRISNRSRPSPFVPTHLEFGEDIAHQLIAINHVAKEHALGARAREQLIDRCSENAALRIVEDIERGRASSALAVAAEILSAPISEPSRQKLLRSFSRRLL